MPTKPSNKAVRLLLPAIGLFWLVSCDRGADEAEPTAAGTATAAGIVREYERGPLEVRLSVDRDEITIAERVFLTVAAGISEEYALTMPLLPAEETEFGIVDYSDTRPALTGEGIVAYERRFELEPFLSGEYSIPELTFRFKQRNGSDEEHELVTEAITITVGSLLPEDYEELVLRDVSPPVSVSRDPKLFGWIGVGGALILLSVTLVLLWMRKRARRRNREITAPAHEVAFAALEAIIAEDLIGRGLINLFYQKISGVLRHYIEDRFGVRAPEQTTEEFLQAVGGDGAFSGERRRILDRFMTHCDLVKFATHAPTVPEIQATFDTCRSFIEESMDSAAKVTIGA